MKSLTVAEFKAQFSAMLSLVKEGESVQILYGKAKRPVALLVPAETPGTIRDLGPLEGKAKFKEKDGGKMNLEDFLGS